MDEKKIKKLVVGLVGIGFLPGFLLPLSISVEKVILFPFFGGMNGFDLLVMIATLMGLAIGIFILIQRFAFASGLGSFIFSFTGGYLLATAINRGRDLGLIFVGLVSLIVSLVIIKYSIRTWLKI